MKELYYIRDEIQANFPEMSVFFYSQSFLESNLKCVWNRSLVEAMQVVKYEGYVSPGVLLLTGDPCSMEVIRGAWCRNVLRPPNSYVITKIGKILKYMIGTK